MRVAHCKGIAVIARLKWVQREHGDAGWQRFLSELPEATREAVDRHILPHGWVPMRVFIDVNVTLDRLFGAGDLSLCTELGAWAANENLPRVFKLFYRLGTPAFLFERASKLWSAHYDTGRLELHTVADGQANLRLFEVTHRAHCLSVLGWAKKSVELSGAEVLEFGERSCCTRGEPCCELMVRWR